MRPILLILLFIITTSLYSQDIIFLSNGEIKKSVVQEITQREVTFKDFLNQEGPLYRLSKEEVNKIIFKNGDVETFQNDTEDVEPSKMKEERLSKKAPIKLSISGLSTPNYNIGGIPATKSEIHNLMREQPVAYEYFNKYTRHRGGRIAFELAGGAAILGTLVFAAATGGENGSVPIFLGTTLGLMTIDVFILSAEVKKIRKAVSVYNQEISKQTSFHPKNPLSLSFGMAKHGVGFTLSL